jgi:SAM-dependent methyltransferase
MAISTCGLARTHKSYRSFDEFYGTDTTYVAVENLQIDSANKEHGHPYEPMPMRLFEKLLKRMKVRYEDYVFLDLGSGKGRTLLLASNYPFKKVTGVEYSLYLHKVALKNIAQYKSRHQRCFNVESVHMDATEYTFPLEPTILFFFNPFDEKIMRTVMTKIRKSLDRHPRDAKFLYYIPRHAYLFYELGFSRDQLSFHEATLRDVRESVRDPIVRFGPDRSDRPALGGPGGMLV